MSKSLVGAQLLVFINGRLFGETTDVIWNSPTPHARRQCIDSLTAYGLDPISASVNGTIVSIRLHGTGGLEGRGIIAPFTHLPREKYFSILIVDRVTSKRVYQADFCKVTNQVWNNSARQRVTGTFSFEGIEWVNEAEYP